MAEVFLCKTGSLKPASRATLRKAGVIVVEVDNPADCQFIRSSEIVSGDDMLWAAMDALRRTYGSFDSTTGKSRERFTLNIFELIDAARNPQREDTGATP
jgi:hypothetical protein